MEILATLPRERWVEREPGAFTLLHACCQGDSTAPVVALLGNGLDVNVSAEVGGQSSDI